MHDTKTLLAFLAKGPAAVESIGRNTGLRGHWLATLLLRLENEKRIVWNQGMWRLADTWELDQGEGAEYPRPPAGDRVRRRFRPP